MSSDRSNSPNEDALELLDRADFALTNDFCPWANKYVYWLKNPFWVLVLAIGGSVACGIFLNPLVFVLTALLVSVTGIGVALPWIAVRGIDCRVVFDVPRTRVGSTAIVRLAIKNRWPFPVWGLSLIKGFAKTDSTDGDEGVALARVPGWSTVEYSWQFEPVRRGLYPNNTAEVETGFPFGLFRAQRAVEIEGQLTVWPPTVRLEGMPDTSESQQTEEQLSERRVGEFGDMMGTRSFRPGDSLRRVHWAQTARQQTLIVTERQAPAMTSVRVVLDLSEGSHLESDREETVELAVETAASICESLHRQHSRVELSLGDNVLIAGDAASGFNRMMDNLAIADVVPGKLSEGSRRDGFEIFITTTTGAKSAHRRQVIVGDGSSGGWLTVADAGSLNEEMPKSWRRACHAS